ncbi:unnamed protein product, partial [Rotaria magnacalcarata]
HLVAMLLHLIVMLAICVLADVRYPLYYTDLRQSSYSTVDCLYAYIIVDHKEDSTAYIRNYHLTPYCRRLDDDLAERYEIDSTTSEIFYNCSPPWFGSMCQYKFFHNFFSSFGDIVGTTFKIRDDRNFSMTSGTCYRFVANCNRELWPLCLDWREICDGKIDCRNGEDEHNGVHN